MSSIKDQPTEGESPLNGAPPSLSVNESPTINESALYPPEWEDCKAEEEEDSSTGVDANEAMKPVSCPVDDPFADGPIIEEVNPDEEIKEEISDNVEMEIANKEADIQVEANQMGRDVSLVSSRGSTRARNVIVSDQIIVKSEEETLSSEMPIIEQVSPHWAERDGESTSNDQNGDVCNEGEIKEEGEEDDPVIEEVNPDDYPLSPRCGNTNEEAGIIANGEASQVTVDAFKGITGGDESAVFEWPADDTQDDDDPIIEEVNPDDYPLSSSGGNDVGQEAVIAGEASQVTVHVENGNVSNEMEINSKNEEDPIIEEVNPDEEIMEEIPDNVVEEETNEETESVVEEAEQAEVTALSSHSLRRSTLVRKSAVKYAVLSEAEDETQQDEPNTGTSDAEESGSDESETENDSEMETDATSETDGSNSIRTGSERKALPCRHCGKRFARKDTLRLHELTHQTAKSRPYVCSAPDCEKAFAKKSSLEAHSRIHSGSRPFKCTTCGDAFHQASSLRRHQVKHQADRPFACKLCGKHFKAKAHLAQHNNLVHSGLKPFTCTVEACGKAFKDRTSLSNHSHIHSGLKAFKCTVCGGAFSCKSSLKKHSRTFHSESPDHPTHYNTGQTQL